MEQKTEDSIVSVLGEEVGESDICNDCREEFEQLICNEYLDKVSNLHLYSPQGESLLSVSLDDLELVRVGQVWVLLGTEFEPEKSSIRSDQQPPASDRH